MTSVAVDRLRVQRLIGAPFARPEDVVRTLTAVQAQDLRASLWAVALRTRDATEKDVEDALARRAIVRTWPMRGTLHFVAPEDARWMLRLMAPRVLQRAASRHRQLGLDAKSIAKSRTLLGKALRDGNALTRAELFAVLSRGGVSPLGQRGIHVLGALAMEGTLVIGAMRGAQPTFALLDEWIVSSRELTHEESLGEIARRYFASHGPATAADFAWWTGLSAADVRRALAISPPPPAAKSARPPRAPAVHLLPPFDELTVAYRDRSASLDPRHAARTRNGIMSPIVTIDGRIAGIWSRARKRDHVRIHVELFTRASPPVRAALSRAAARYGRFLGLRAELLAP